MGKLRAAAVSLAFLIAALATPPLPAAAAEGCDTPGAPTSTVYLPSITKTLGGATGWVTPFVVQNAGTATTTVELSFYSFSDGSLVACRKVSGLAPSASFADVPNDDADLPGNTQFSAVVRSFGSPVVVVVNQHRGTGTRAEALSHAGITAGSTSVSLPYVAKSASGWTTTFVIQNLGSVATTVTASFASYDGTRTATLTRAIDGGRAAAVDPSVEADLVAGTEYAVTLTSAQPIGAVANAHNDASSVAAPRAFSYDGVGSTPTQTYVPWIARGADGSYSRIVVQNRGSAAAKPVLTFRRIGATGQAVVTAPTAVAPGRAWSYLLPSTSRTCPAAGSRTCPAIGEHSLQVSGSFAVLAYATDARSALAATGVASTVRSYLPTINRALGGSAGWTTSIVVRSIGATSAVVRYYGLADGVLAATQYVGGLVAGSGVRIDPRAVSGLADGAQYSAVVDTPGGGAAVALSLSSLGGDGAMSYEGFAATGRLSTAPSPTTIALEPPSASVSLGGTQQFTATVRDQSGNAMTGVPILWSSLPTAIGTVSSAGLFTSTGTAGTATVRATFGRLSASAAVAVAVATRTVGGISFVVRTTTTADVFIERSITSTEQSEIAGSVDADVRAVQNDLGRTFASRPQIYAFGSSGSATTGNQTIFGMTLTTARSFAAAGGYFDTRSSTSVVVNWYLLRTSRPNTTTRHELTHMLEQQIAGRNTDIPAWFNEGTARTVDLTVPGAGWKVLLGRYTPISAAHVVPSRLLSLPALTSQEDWNARRDPELGFQYHQAARAVAYLRADVGTAATVRVLELLGQGQSFEAAFLTATGRTVAAFWAALPARLRADASSPGIVTSTESSLGPGLSLVAYGFAPSSTVTFTAQRSGFLDNVFTVTTNAYGVYATDLGPSWPRATYTLIVTGSDGRSARTTAAKAASLTLSDLSRRASPPARPVLTELPIPPPD